MIPKIAKERCTECGECVKVCPGQVFSFERGKVEIVAPEECIECRACEEACPTGAVRLVDPA